MSAFSLLVLRQNYSCLLPPELVAERLRRVIQPPTSPASQGWRQHCVGVLDVAAQTFTASMVRPRSSEPSLQGRWYAAVAGAGGAETVLELVVCNSPAGLMPLFLLVPLLLSFALLGVLSRSYLGATALLLLGLLLTVMPRLEMRGALRYFERALPLSPLA